MRVFLLSRLRCNRHEEIAHCKEHSMSAKLFLLHINFTIRTFAWIDFYKSSVIDLYLGELDMFCQSEQHN